MEKLTIKELAPYLPYGLKIRNILGKGSVWTLTRFNIEQFSDDDKPLLRPLSQLTEEICHNGEKFVPIEEIAKIEAPAITGAQEKIHSITSFNRGLSFNSRQRGVTYKYEGVVVEITHYKDAVFHKKVISGNDSWVFSYFHNYPEILRKLHEWNFDVFGLHERGLALPIEGKEVKS